MDDLYRAIEEKIHQSGYIKEIDGRDFYNDISREAELQENGLYFFLIKKEDDVIYKGSMDIFDDEFDLHYVDICDGEKTYHIDFDRE